MRVTALLACLLALLTVTVRARTAPHVIVLQPHGAELEPWPQGNQAVIAELAASSYELLLRANASRDLRALQRELQRAAHEPGALGAVAVGRQGSTGMALVVTVHGGLVRIEVDTDLGAVAEGRAALRVAELLRSIEVPAPTPEPARETPPPPPPPLRSRSEHRIQLWGGGGIALSSHFDAPLPLLAAGGSFGLWSVLGAELELRAAPVATSVQTPAGELELRAEQATAHLTFDPFARQQFGVAVGLGGGVLRLREWAASSEGFAGRQDQTTVALLSARARAFARSGALVGSLVFEPGLTVPRVSVRAGEQEVAQLGRPWLCVTARLGWQL